jgi:uncharacterized protein
VSGSRSRVQESPGDSPTTIDISRLHRQPGSLLELSFELPAPGDLHVSMARVPEGSPVEMDVSVESVVEGIWVSGAADVDVVAECSRCLDSVEWSQMVSIEQMFRYPATDARGALVEEPQDDDEETPEVVADTIDMHGPLRDAIVLSLPLAPLCSPDCQGICPTCGERVEVDGDPHDHPVSDPRWSALEQLLAESPPPTPEER